MGDALGKNDGPTVGMTDVNIVGSADGATEVNIGFTDGIEDGNVVGTSVGDGTKTGAPVSGTATGVDVEGATDTANGAAVGGVDVTTGATVVGASEVKKTSPAPWVKEQVVYK